MLTKLLNPFEIRVSEATDAYVVVGSLAAVALHLGFYATVVHFILKFW